MRVLFPVLPVSLVAGLCGCFTHEWYVVPRHAPSEPSASPASPATSPTDSPAAMRPSDAAASAPIWVAAQRRSDDKQVWVRSAAIDWTAVASLGDQGLLVRARAYNPAVTAGSTLTWVGTAISLLGSGLFLAGRVRGDEALFLAGSLTALSAEPVMWAGIGYWLAGTMRPPFESPRPVVTAPAAALSDGAR